MSKLDWSKAGLRSSDPGRVVDVGDYGILPDHLAGRKGNLKPRRKKPKKKKAAQSVCVGPVRQKDGNKSRKREAEAQHVKAKAKNNLRRGGLTIPEMIARAGARVNRIAADVRNAERKLVILRGQLRSAERDLLATKNTPRRSAIGRALHEEEKKSAANNASHR